jgi:DNA-binding XRE family transcriptional regulator
MPTCLGAACGLLVRTLFSFIHWFIPEITTLRQEKCRHFAYISYSPRVNKLFAEKDLAGLAKKYREEAGKTRAAAARDMGVSQTSVFHAEESPRQSLFKLRKRMVEKYSSLKLVGPVYSLEKKP